MKYYLGIDLGGTNIAVGLIDEQHRFVAKYSTPTHAFRSFQVVVADIADAARKTLNQAGKTLRDIEYVGIGAPSTIDPQTNCIMHANNLNWINADLISEFRKHMDIEVHLANDADCATYGEAIAGVASKYSSVMMLTLGTGLGGGLVMDNKLFLGGSGYGCEPGHSTLVMDGELCTCGRRGCLEAYASVTALIRDTIRAMTATPDSILHRLCGGDTQNVTGRTPFEAAKLGDSTAVTVVNNYVHYLATGISSFVTLLRPQAIILGGGVCNEGEYLLTPLRKEVNETVYAAKLMPEVPILRAELGNDAGIIGAALFAAGQQ